MKPDFYTLIHKALRRRLFLLAIEFGKLDAADSLQIQFLQQELTSLCTLLHEHAEHEVTCFHPVIRKHLPNAANNLDNEHAQQEASLHHIQSKMQLLVSRKDLTKNQALILEIYLLFNDFIADYLKHLDEEEKIMPQLWECCPEAELLAALNNLFASLKPTELRASLKYMLPALNSQERKLLGPG